MFGAHWCLKVVLVSLHCFNGHADQGCLHCLSLDLYKRVYIFMTSPTIAMCVWRRNHAGTILCTQRCLQVDELPGARIDSTSVEH